MKLQELATRPSSHAINQVNETRFGFRMDYGSLTLGKARALSRTLSESLMQLKQNFGAHAAQKNSKYMELIMVREGLLRWIDENRPLTESEIAKSGAILAAKDIVDSFQDMLEDISKMQNEQLPALLDTIRDQIGQPQADAFKGTVTPLLQELVGQMQQARETADAAARVLAGEQVAAPMNMGTDQMPAMPDQAMAGAQDQVPQEDDFAATDAAAGGTQAIGRDKR